MKHELKWNRIISNYYNEIEIQIVVGFKCYNEIHVYSWILFQKYQEIVVIVDAVIDLKSGGELNFDVWYLARIAMNSIFVLT